MKSTKSKTSPDATTKSVIIKDLSIRKVVIPVVGETPLIVHAWSEKAIRQIQDKQSGAAKAKKA